MRSLLSRGCNLVCILKELTDPVLSGNGQKSKLINQIAIWRQH